MRFSLLSLIIIASLILLVIKTSDIVTKYNLFSLLSPVTAAYAQDPDKETESEPDKEDDAQTDGDKKSDKNQAEDVPLDQKSSDRVVRINQAIEYTPTELNILQRLASRREELTTWEKELEIKESILRITQEKIDNKITELRTLKQQVEEILEEYNAKESKKIQSLVKIYENMKPKPAAKIFSQLDMDTLLTVTENMKEDKVANILAKMEPGLAKDLTITFAQHGKLIPPNALK